MSSLMVISLATLLFSADGKIYKCVGANGMPVYKNAPCNPGQKGNEIKTSAVPLPPPPKPPKAAVQAAQQRENEQASDARPIMPTDNFQCLDTMRSIRREFDSMLRSLDNNIAKLEQQFAVNEQQWQESKTSKVADEWQPKILAQRREIESSLNSAKASRLGIYQAEAERYKKARANCPK